MMKGTQTAIMVNGKDQLSGETLNSDMPHMPCNLLVLRSQRWMDGTLRVDVPQRM
jgi:hypothetical protein